MSVLEAVRAVSDQLSEAVSQFTLYVVKLKEARAGLPENLTKNVDTVCNQCFTMVDLAQSIAASYGEFPTIEAEIRSEALGLESSAKNMQLTAGTMSGAEHSQEVADSWEMLSNACGAIAKSVIRLLEILYDAELKRIYMQAEKSQKEGAKAKAFTPEQIDSDEHYQDYAAAASDAASEAAQLATYLTARAAAEESPVMKQELEKAAKELHTKAEALAGQANACVESNADPATYAAFQQTSDAIKQETSQIVEKIKEQERRRKQMLEQARAPAPAPAPAAAPAPRGRGRGSPRGAPRGRGRGSPRGAPRGRGRGRGGARAAGGQKVDKNWQPNNMKQVADAMTDLAKDNEGKGILGCSSELALEIQKLADAAKRGAGSELLQAARNISSITDKFSVDVKANAKLTKNPNIQDKLFMCANVLKDNCRQLKILASVKATTISEANHMDKDEQLICLTTNLVKMWKETGDNLEIAKLVDYRK